MTFADYMEQAKKLSQEQLKENLRKAGCKL